MSGLGGILDVAIGMAFVYLLLSMVCSGLNELVAWARGLRAKTLEDGVAALLRDPRLEKLGKDLYEHPLVKGLSSGGKPSYLPSGTFVLALLDTLGDHAADTTGLARAVRALAPAAPAAPAAPGLREALEGWAKELEAETAPVPESRRQAIAAGLEQVLPQLGAAGDLGGETVRWLRGGRRPIDTLRGIKGVLADLPPGSDVRRQLELFSDETVKDAAQYRRRLEAWFDESMERVSGVYKRQAQRISIVVGLALAVAMGVDSGLLVDGLMHDDALRQVTAATAVEYVKAAAQQDPQAKSAGAPAAGDAARQVDDAVGKLKELKLPIGLPYLYQHAKASKNEGIYWILRLLGIAFTGFAVALGAPFWFDLLSKLINLRLSGDPPQTTQQRRDEGDR